MARGLERADEGGTMLTVVLAYPFAHAESGRARPASDVGIFPLYVTIADYCLYKTNRYIGL